MRRPSPDGEALLVVERIAGQDAKVAPRRLKEGSSVR